MYRCRHCTYQDYERLVKTSNEYLANLMENGFDQDELDKYLEFISDYDDDISYEIKLGLSSSNLEKSEVKEIIEEQLETLYSEVLVDIREHQ